MKTTVTSRLFVLTAIAAAWSAAGNGATLVAPWNWTLTPVGTFSSTIDLVSTGPLGHIRTWSEDFSGTFVIGHTFTAPDSSWTQQTPFPTETQLKVLAGWSGNLISDTVTLDYDSYSSGASVRMDAWAVSTGLPPFASSYPGYFTGGLRTARFKINGGGNTTVAVKDGATVAARGLMEASVFYGDNLGNASATVESHSFMSIYAELVGPATVDITYTKNEGEPPLPAEPASFVLAVTGLLLVAVSRRLRAGR